MDISITSACDAVLNELYKFSKDIASLGDTIFDDRIKTFESTIGFDLPLDFKYILTKHNYLSLGGTEVYGIGEEFGNISIENLYIDEHEEAGNPMFREYLPFSPDGYGNHYCLDLSKLENNTCPVVFWEHDCYYTNKADVEQCNENFTEWIKEVMIAWTLNETNYDGSEKK